mmetsp:Transcript_33935/g.63388  ORF Transcript_33935/g.63388 Transcript_33935/m.63388 type:complete len:240 (+) Transcript_33935:143-862(+)
MVDDPLRVPLVQRGGRMDVDLVVIGEGAVPLLRIPSAGVAEVPSRDALPNAVVVVATGHDLKLVSVHQRDQLLPHILRAPQGARLDEVLVAPGVGEAVMGPRLVHLQQGAVVTLGLVELRLLLICQGLLVFGSVEHVLNRQHGHNGHDLVTTPQVHGGQEHLGQRRLHWELRHLPPQVGEHPLVIEGAQGPERLKGIDQGLHWRGVHEVKAQHVLDAHGLEEQDGVGEVRPLDLRDSCR